MNKLVIKGTNQNIYYERLTNGLEVYLAPNEKQEAFYVTYSTKYGSVHNEFVPLGAKKYCKFPEGIAHFLEHKLFEQESGLDPFSFFAKSGTIANANTSFFKTSYLFYGVNDFEANLNYLLDYVSKPYLTDKNVEKEKGIIEQELRMYDDMPFWVLVGGLKKNAFHHHPIKQNIAGSLKSIKAITKEDLLTCYNTFYHPSNMILIITGNFSKEKALDLIKKKHSATKTSPLPKIKLKKYSEPNTVVKERLEKQMAVEVPKVALGIKIPLTKLKDFDLKVINLYLGLLGNILFGSTSKFLAEMVEKGYIIGDLSSNRILVDNYFFAQIGAESNQPSQLIMAIKKYLNGFKVNKKDFERIKKVFISSYYLTFDDILAVNNKLLSNIINYNKLYLNEIDLLKDLNKEELDKIIKLLDLNQVSTCIITPKKNK
ncbi:MAG: pitrilysin family protein [Bacilli bacterium]|nr:pitrilysin family protein [Bacilli bacterium]